MTKVLRIAVLGFWHVHADGFAQQVVADPSTELVAIWDDDAARGAEAAGRFGVGFVESLESLLARPDIDGVIVTTATTAHVRVIRAALAAGKHVFTEKLLAPTVEECHDLLERAAAADRRIVVALPRLTDAPTLAALALVQSDEVGRLVSSKIHMSHDGWVAGWLPERFGDSAESLGGAMADLGSHPAYLARVFHGTSPVRTDAQSTSLTGRNVEDYVIATTRYEDGSLGLIESSIAEPGGGYRFELVGVHGAVRWDEASRVFEARTGAGPWTRRALPLSDPDPVAQWIEHIHRGSDAVDNLAAAIDLTRFVGSVYAALGTSFPFTNAGPHTA